MPIKLIGRTTNFSGKTLWEILGNLKNFGVGRIVIRNTFQRYPEPTFLKIVKVEPLPNEERRKVRVWVEKTFRGYKQPKLVEICSVSYKDDYRLVPKELESNYVDKKIEVNEKILPADIELPPLLKELILRDKKAKGESVTNDLKIPLIYKPGREKRARIAQPGETPNVAVGMGLGTPASPELYKGLL